MIQNDLFKKIVAHSKEYGFIYQSSEVYDGLSAVYDYGPYGVELKNNIKEVSSGGPLSLDQLPLIPGKILTTWLARF